MFPGEGGGYLLVNLNLKPLDDPPILPVIISIKENVPKIFDNRDSKTKMILKKGTPCAFFTKYNPGQ